MFKQGLGCRKLHSGRHYRIWNFKSPWLQNRIDPPATHARGNTSTIVVGHNTSTNGWAVSTKNLSSASRAVPLELYYNDVWEVKMPMKHRFPMEKYRQTRLRVQQRFENSTPQALSQTSNGSVFVNFTPSPLVSMTDLCRTHDPAYVHRYLNNQMTPEELRNVGFPWSQQHVNRSLSSVGGTVAAARQVCNRMLMDRFIISPTHVWFTHTHTYTCTGTLADTD